MRGNVSYGGSKSLQWALSCEGNSPGKKIDAVFGSAVWCHKLPGHWSMGVWDSQRTSFSHSSSLESAAEPEWKCHRCTLLSAAYRVAWIQHRFVYLLGIFFSSSSFFFFLITKSGLNLEDCIMHGDVLAHRPRVTFLILISSECFS